MEAKTHAEMQLRKWLNRIEEACAYTGASPEITSIRDAALAALWGKPAPDGFGLPPQKTNGVATVRGGLMALRMAVASTNPQALCADEAGTAMPQIVDGLTRAIDGLADEAQRHD